jgi:type IV pilus assembly protein PilM
LGLDLSFLSLSTPSVIGLDISSYAVKMVELAPDKGSARKLERYAIEPLPRFAVTEGNIGNIDEVTDTVQRCWKRLGTKTRQVALALPSSAVIMKKIALQANLSENDMEAQVNAEANQYIPFSLDEVNLDFEVLGPSAGEPADVDVLIAAARREKVDDRVACAEGAGLKATVMDVETHAILNAFELSGNRGVTALVGVGLSMMSLIVVEQGEVVFSREQAFGGTLLTDEVVRAYGMSYEEADQAKINRTLPVNYESELLAPFLENLALEVSRAMQFFFTSLSRQKVDRIVLYGGCACLPGVAELVEEKNETRTLISNPFYGMGLGTRVREKQLKMDAPMLLTACGLALRRFDP